MLFFAAQPVPAEDKDPAGPAIRLNLEQSVRSWGEAQAVRTSVPIDLIGDQRLHFSIIGKKNKLDASPLFDDFLSAVRNTGIPLRAISDKSGERTIGVAAHFNVSEVLPAVTFRAGQSLPDAFGAFSAARSMSWALAWPVQHYTLQLEGGSRTDFGYFAIGGVQWQSPARPLAIGIGFPLKPRNAHGGPIGVLLQIRAKW